MIAHLRGEPVLTGDRWVVIDVGGIGYQVQVTQPELQLISTTQEKVKLFTYMAVREDAITLYGFLHQSELEMFRILIGVSGIGPQTAMNLLSQIGIEDFAIAILNEDEKASDADFRDRHQECQTTDPRTPGQNEENQRDNGMR